MNKPANIHLPAETGDGDSHAIRVLLAEDTPISAEAIKAMAKHLSVMIDHASNGVETIEMIEQAHLEGRPYSLLLIDVMMPIIDGIEATTRLRALGFDAEQLPIIAVTAATSFDEVRAYRACGMQGFLAKPVSLSDLRATLEAWGQGPRGKSRMRSARIEPELLKALKIQFQDRNQHTLKLIEDELNSNKVSDRAIEEIKHRLHQIAGTAATFGDPALSEAAREHENALNEAVARDFDIRDWLQSAAHTLQQRINR